MLLGALLMVSGVVVQVADAQPVVSTVMMVAGMVYILKAAKISRHGEESMKGDERTRKIGAFASAYSWFLTLIAMTVLFWLDYLSVVALTIQHALGILIFFMVLSLLAFRWHLIRKGDVR